MTTPTHLLNLDQAATIARQALSVAYPNLVLAYLVDAHPRLVANAMIATGQHEAPELELVDEPAAELEAAVAEALGQGQPGAHRAAWAQHRFFGWLTDRRQADEDHGAGCICAACTDRRLDSRRRSGLLRAAD